ncbi:MAG: hypothetical protein ACRENO_07170, partial [Thermodesulfobacteriota bacterium]
FCTVNLIIGQKGISLGILLGGLLFTFDYTAIRFIVKLLTEKKYNLGFSLFLILIKLLILLGIIACLFLFAKVNFYGFIIGLTSVVIIIIGKSLKDQI